MMKIRALPRSGLTPSIEGEAARHDSKEAPHRAAKATADTDTPCILFDQICKSYVDRDGRLVEALREVTLGVHRGAFVSLLGPSGCGKSTLLNIAAGFVKPSRGVATFDGRAIAGPGPQRGMVFQQYALFPWLDVRRNILFGPHCTGHKHEAEKRLGELISLVGLDGCERRYPHELSGGMQQRVALARTLISDPDVLLMDEPFAAVDAMTREGLQDQLLAVWMDRKPTVVFVTHSIMEAAYLSDEVVLLDSKPGRLVDLHRIEAPRPRDRADEGFLKEYAVLEAKVRMMSRVR